MEDEGIKAPHTSVKQGCSPIGAPLPIIEALAVVTPIAFTGLVHGWIFPLPESNSTTIPYGSLLPLILSTDSKYSA